MADLNHTGPPSSPERAILVGVTRPSLDQYRAQEFLEELTLLAESAGAEVTRQVIQDRKRIAAAYFIGRGKAEEIASFVEEEDVRLVIFDDDLSPVQVRNLERLIPCKIMDRSALILDIFASRARSREARTQVELAQLQYMLPRLTRQWTHLSKQYGGIGTKGPGETQIETDRRAIRSRINHLNSKLRSIKRERNEQRKGREGLPRVSLVGYTNAGKSTILNLFTGAEVLVEDRLFATLDSTVRMVNLSPVHRILLSDTVGFIRKLPHPLIASFRSTLDEVREADILLHVVDVSHPLFGDHISVVNETLEEIGAGGKPTIMVYNKIDRLRDRTILGHLVRNGEHAVCVSAKRSINRSGLEEKIIDLLEMNVSEQTIRLGHEDYPLIARIHELAEIVEKRYEEDQILLRFRMNTRAAERMKKILERSSPDAKTHTTGPAAPQDEDR
jgi:GTP-binding protein HflX